MFHHKGQSGDLKMLTVASILLTIPFVFYAKDIASSLRAIADRRPEDHLNPEE